MRRRVWVAVFAVAGLAGAPALAARPGGGHFGAVVAPAGAGEKGVVVREVPDVGPAASSGLKVGDRVVKVGPDAVADVDGFLKAVAKHSPGDEIELTVVRGGKERTLSATLATPPGRPAPPRGDAPRLDALRPDAPRLEIFRLESPGPVIGVAVESLTPALRDRLKVKAEAGVVVGSVMPGLPAAKAGIKADDVITAVGGKPVASPEELRGALRGTKPGASVAVALDRAGEKLTVTATPQPAPPGGLALPGGDGPGAADFEALFGPSPRVAELERRLAESQRKLAESEKRVADLEKRLAELEKKAAPPKK